MLHSYDKKQRRLPIGEIDVRIAADVHVRIDSHKTHPHGVTNIERNDDADRSLAQQEAVSVQFCSSAGTVALYCCRPSVKHTPS